MTFLLNTKSNLLSLLPPSLFMKLLPPDGFVHEQGCAWKSIAHLFGVLHGVHSVLISMSFSCEGDEIPAYALESLFWIFKSQWCPFRLIKGKGTGGVESLYSMVLSEETSACSYLDLWPGLSPLQNQFWLEKIFPEFFIKDGLKGIEWKGRESLVPGDYTSNWSLPNWQQGRVI